MAMQVETEQHDPGIASLMAGIMNDARELIVQQMTLFQVEIKNDIRKTFMALIPIIAGAGVFVIAMLMLMAAASLFLSWYFPSVPVWGGFAIVGGAFGAIGAVLIIIGNTMLARNNPLPEKAIQGLKENIQWKTKN